MAPLNCMPFTFLDSFKRIFCGLFSCWGDVPKGKYLFTVEDSTLMNFHSYFAIVAVLRFTDTLDYNLYRFAFSFSFGFGMIGKAELLMLGMTFVE